METDDVHLFHPLRDRAGESGRVQGICAGLDRAHPEIWRHHHGYFVPGGSGDVLPDASFSFPGIGREGPPHIGIALFSFPSIEAYERYRRDVAQDEGCKAATARFNETPCFSGYERTFLVPMFD